MCKFSPSFASTCSVDVCTEVGKSVAQLCALFTYAGHEEHAAVCHVCVGICE